MACTQTLNGILRDCLPNAGGLRAVYLANFSEVDYFGANGGLDPDDDSITGVDMDGGAVFHEYQFDRNTASISSNFAVNAENGTKYVETDLVMVFNRMNTAKRNALIALAKGELTAIVEDNNGKQWVLGVEHPLVMSAHDGLTGTAYGDRNGYSITLHTVSPNMPYGYSGTIPTS